ncbi:MAG: PHP domain-containing protein [Thermovirgaceae bacterium]
MIRIDLHMHSTFSDGLLDPEMLVRRSKKRGVSILSLTDHDTVAGIPSFRHACRKWNVQCICGTELSADADFTLHILGYRIDENMDLLESRLEDIRRKRNDRNRLMCEKLRAMGMDITMEELAGESGGQVVARPHMARLLVRKGYVPDEMTAFSWYLGKNGSAYVSRKRLTATECLQLIGEAGGLAVLAHPGLMGITEKRQENLLEELTAAGLWGIECFSGHHSEAETLYWSNVAARFGLQRTAGSDFHDGSRPGRLGVAVPEDLLSWARLGVSL